MPYFELSPKDSKRSPQFSIGIGRGVSQEWYDNFKNDFSQLAGGSVTLDGRKLPGTNYVSASELEKISKETLKGDICKRAVTAHTRALIAHLCLSSQLDGDSSYSPKEFKIPEKSRRFRLKNKNSTSRLFVVLKDQASPTYNEGLLVAGEKTVIRQSLGLDQHKQEFDEEGNPTFNINLGIVSGPTNQIDGSFTRELNNLLQGVIKLEPVDITHL